MHARVCVRVCVHVTACTVMPKVHSTLPSIQAVCDLCMCVHMCVYVCVHVYMVCVCVCVAAVVVGWTAPGHGNYE